MSLLMIHEAYIPVYSVYIGVQFFLRAGRLTGSPEVVQEVLADPKISIFESDFC